eukprot:CAMPEP_0174253580 /NCGR_PEP_ID=MMETSP0439-20130205/2947_1 /TAXON_ID=0 /ORGANISM="Stereomyxa ramosa, Strain Chinc5" /LENGTH=170 /DNA_ID=CAMNT_0015334681 /DNA_START=42 /DNA_END=554 /DNA_ORIENTATION=-
MSEKKKTKKVWAKDETLNVNSRPVRTKKDTERFSFTEGEGPQTRRQRTQAAAAKKRRAKLAESRKRKRGSSRKGGRKKRAKKDPNAPKKGKSAYIFFSIAIRPSVVKKYPKLQQKEIMSKIGEKWRALPKKDKAKYEKLAAKDKARYDREMKRYNPPSASSASEVSSGSE